MKTVLLTGFEPFEDRKLNASWEAVRRLQGQQLALDGAGVRVKTCCLPCAFGASRDRLLEAVNQYQPDVIIATGEAPGRSAIALERIAINIMDARIADNHGQQPIDAPIEEGGSPAWFSRLPIKAIVHELRGDGIPAYVSNTAGTYVCNYIMYALLQHLYSRPEIKAGFVHLPVLPSQASDQPLMPTMSAELAARALKICVEQAVLRDHDIRTAHGANH